MLYPLDNVCSLDRWVNHFQPSFTSLLFKVTNWTDVYCITQYDLVFCYLISSPIKICLGKKLKNEEGKSTTKWPSGKFCVREVTDMPIIGKCMWFSLLQFP